MACIQWLKTLPFVRGGFTNDERVFRAAVPVDVYPLDLLGFCGRQSAKLPDKVDVVWGSESDSDDLGVYTLNDDGTVARIDGGSWSYELIY